ncbi:hypothetical protein CCR84_04240 [Rhodocyclus purpureus]|nr:hypothetical protein [Rhodocyclus purpureus]
MRRYFPVIVCAEHDSPLDALVAMKLPRDEAQDLVVASWLRVQGEAIVARIDGGRHVATLPLADGRWAAGNAYPEPACPTLADAERRLARLLRGGRRGCIAWVEAHPL